MFYAVVFFGAFCIVPAVDGSDKISGNSANPFEFGAFLFCSAAARADIVDDSVVPTDAVAINRVVDRAISNSGFFHAADDALKCFEVFAGIAVHLDIADVAGVGQRVW